MKSRLFASAVFLVAALLAPIGRVEERTQVEAASQTVTISDDREQMATNNPSELGKTGQFRLRPAREWPSA